MRMEHDDLRARKKRIKKDFLKMQIKWNLMNSKIKVDEVSKYIIF